VQKNLKAVELQKRGLNNLEKEDYESAIDDLTLAVELKPTYPDINNALGVAHFFGGSREMALEYFKRACELNPEYLEARLHLAFAHIELGNLEDGESLLNEIPDPDECRQEKWDSRKVFMCELHSNLGQMYEKRGQLLEAQHEYRKAIKLQPGFLDTMLKLARTYSKLELFDEAHREFDRILKSNPDYHEARIELGMLFMREGEYEEARRQWEKCLSCEYHSLRARFYIKKLVRGEFKDKRVSNVQIPGDTDDQKESGSQGGIAIGPYE